MLTASIIECAKRLTIPHLRVWFSGGLKNETPYCCSNCDVFFAHLLRFGPHHTIAWSNSIATTPDARIIQTVDVLKRFT